MMLYFAWTPQKETFDPHRHQRHDLEIFHIEVTQQESDVARASLLVQNTLQDLTTFTDKKHAIISTKNASGEAICLFQGHLQGPVKIDGNCVLLELTAAPEDVDKQLQDLMRHHKGDPLFVPAHKEESPAESLKSQSAVLYFDRLGHTVSLSDLFEGRHFLDLNQNFYGDSLQLKSGAQPLESVEITLEVQWIQRMRSYASLSRKIASAFPEKIINTFTGKNFAKKWPKTGQSLRNSGYWVAVSHLEEITPPRTGGLNLYPTTSSPLWVQHKDNTPTQAYVKRSWFKGRLILGWSYKQKRTERLTFTLKQQFHDFFKEASAPLEKIHLTLGEISPKISYPFWHPHKRYDLGFKIQDEGKIYRCLQSHRSKDTFSKDSALWIFEKNIPTALGPQSRSSFFVTDRGVQAFEYALEIAKTHLAYRARALQVSFCGSWEDLCQISLDHTIRLQDRRLPGGSVRGKVIAYAIIAEGKTGERRVEVTLAVSIGSGKTSEDTPKGIPAYAVDYMEEPSVAKGSLKYARYDTQTPQDPFATVHRLSHHAMIKSLRLKNKAQDQEAYLREQQYPQGNIDHSILKDHVTEIHLSLNPLSSKEAIEHTIEAQVLTTWSAPKQIQ